MKKCKILLAAIIYLVAIKTSAQQPFAAGNILVARVGDGTTVLASGTAAPVYIDEFTPTGNLVQTVSLPISSAGANLPLTFSGANQAGLMLNLSSNGQFVVLTGFNASPGTIVVPSLATSIPRTIGLINYNLTINTTTALTDYSSNSSPCSVVTPNGTDFWCNGIGTTSGSGGVRYATIGATTSTQLNTAPSTGRCLEISNGQLYLSGNGTPRVGTLGVGLPTTSGQTATALPGFPTTGTYHQFVFFDMNGTVPGVDVLYVANELAGIQKYAFDGTTWTAKGTVGSSTDLYMGLAGTLSGSTVTLFATKIGTNNTNTRGGEFVTVTDASGYIGTLSGSVTSLSTVIGRFGANDVATYRGVALVPQQPTAKISAKIFLQGAYNSASGRHKDVTSTWAAILNANALSQPYNTAAFGNYAGTESVAANFFQSTPGTTDILDWVLLELRDQTTPSTVIARRAAFVREDGQIVDLDGNSAVSFTNVTAGNYYLVVRHRNHLPVRMSVTFTSDGNYYSSAATYDFTIAQSQGYQDGAISSNAAMKDFGGVFGMWGGNANSNTTTRYTGLNNDAGVLLAALGSNQAAVLTSVYSNADLNMDGTVRYTGLNNDAGVLLSILSSNQAAVINQHQ